MRFEADRVDRLFDFVKHLDERQRQASHDGSSSKDHLRVMATGGGAFKYYEEMKEKLGVEVLREDEMECLIMGLDFFIAEIPREVFTYSDEDDVRF